MDWRDNQVVQRAGQMKRWRDGSQVEWRDGLEVERKDGLEELIGWID